LARRRLQSKRLARRRAVSTLALVNPARFSDRIAIVVGADAGIGATSARRLASEGATVVAVGDDIGAIDTLVSDITNAGGVARSVHAAIDDPGAATRIVAALELPRIDVLVNHQSLVEFGGLDATTLETWERVLCANLTVPFAWSK